jgi:hypothetical protein
MNFNVNGAGGVILALVTGLVGFSMSLLWLYIGWRAMRAHERLAAAAEELALRDR